MKDINKIIEGIDKFLKSNNQKITTPVEVSPYLEELGLLNNSASRPGLPLRKLLRDDKISHAYQEGVRWQIPHSGDSQRN